MRINYLIGGWPISAPTRHVALIDAHRTPWESVSKPG